MVGEEGEQGLGEPQGWFLNENDGGFTISLMIAVLGVLGVAGEGHFEVTGRPSSRNSSKAEAKLSWARAVDGDMSCGVRGVTGDMLGGVWGVEEGDAGTASRVDLRLRLKDLGIPLWTSAQAWCSRKLEANVADDLETDDKWDDSLERKMIGAETGSRGPDSRFSCLSNSANWPTKFMFGDMVGLRVLTYLWWKYSLVIQ